MKITSISIENFLGARRVAVDTTAPVQIFCGPNGSGKSSCRDAIALALTADLGRVSLKKEAGRLVTDGADVAMCAVHAVNGIFEATITAAGKATLSDVSDIVPAYVLDAQRFARLDAAERRTFLFGLMGLKTDSNAVVERLERRGLDAARVSRIAPLLRAGFEAACKEAKSKATEAKGAWRATTGETYGSEKAKTWRATAPAVDAAAAKALATELQHLDVALEAWQQQIGKQRSEQARRDALQAKLPGLVEKAGMLERIRSKLATDEAEDARLQGEIAKAAAAAGTAPRVGLVHDLAAAVNYLIAFGDDTQASNDAAAALDAYEGQYGKVGAATGDPEAAALLLRLNRAGAICGNAINNGRRDLDAALAAQAEVTTIKAELSAGPALACGDLESATKQAEQLKQQRTAIVAKQDTQKALKALADSAEKKTKDAGAHAADVAAWDAIGDALAPDGIPAEILAAAMGPINARLAQSALDAEWPAVVIAQDMGITADGRERRLLSESEQWRCDAMIAEAVAHLSGARLLVLDRFDVLDQAGRGQLIGWLDALATAGEIDTALVFGTLKSVPANLPDTCAAHWIERGVLGQLKEAA